MKFAYSWLKELSKTSLTPQQAADRLTMLGLEVESLATVSAEFSGVVVGEVMKVQHIEGSDHLKLCQVNIGAENILQIVCGAPNVAAGQKVPVAQIGAVLPGDFKIKKAKLRGVTSHGMICSSAELGLSGDTSGILVLDAKTQLGTDLKDALNLSEESVFELSITPNRPDCLGMNGIAREICVSENRFFQMPKPPRVPISQNQEKYSIEIKAIEACPRYSARIIRNVKVGSSPAWLVERVTHAGMRSINNIVDITNYVMLLTGQPLHAFDLDKLKSGKIVIRNAYKAEEFKTLDEKLHKLSDENLLICDGDLPVAIAGVMGGENSEVDESTTSILLESAYFSPTSVRKTAKKLGISTEASKRFERGVDPNGVPAASDAATALLCEYANGEARSELIDAYPAQIAPAQISFRRQRANLVIGASVPEETASAILINLGCEVEKSGEALQVNAPTFRPDLTREIDLIEEVARVYGYDKVEPAVVDTLHLDAQHDQVAAQQDGIKQAAVQSGLSEVMTFSFISEKNALPFVQTASELVKLLNPLSEEMAVLRPSLFASMLPAIAYNVNRKATNLRFFELGSTFSSNDSNGLREEVKLGALLTGKQAISSWAYPDRELSFYDAKGVCEAILEQAGVPGDELEFKELEIACFKYGAQIWHSGEAIGIIGAMHAEILAQFDIDNNDVFGFELHFKKLQQHLRKPFEKYKPLSPYPFVERDLAILVDHDVSAAAMIDCIRRAGGGYLNEIRLFDIYTGKQIPADRKSLAIALRFQAPDKTLKDSEIDGTINKILMRLQKELKAGLRQ